MKHFSKQSLAIAALSAVTVTSLCVTGWAVFLRPAPKLTDYAPAELEPNAVAYTDDPSEGKLEAASGGGAVSISYTKRVVVDTASKTATLNYANPASSVNYVAVHKDILIITGHNKRAIEDHFDYNPELELNLREHGKEELLAMVKEIGDINLHYIRQKEPKGLGHAILCAKSFIGTEPFAVLLGDDVVYNEEKPCLQQLIDVYDTTGASVLGCQTVPQEKVSSYGIVASEETDDERIFKVRDMVEKPKVEEAPSRLAVLGRYVITPEIFAILEQTAPGRGGEIQLTDALKVLAQEQAMYAYDFVGRRYDVGDKQGYLEATVEYALRRPEMREKFLRYLEQIVK